MNKEAFHKKEIVYFAHIIPQLGIYDVCEIIIRTIEDDYFAGIDKHDKRAYLFSYNSINKTIFKDRKDALAKVKQAEKLKPIINEETYYEQY